MDDASGPVFGAHCSLLRSLELLLSKLGGNKSLSPLQVIHQHQATEVRPEAHSLQTLARVTQHPQAMGRQTRITCTPETLGDLVLLESPLWLNCFVALPPVSKFLRIGSSSAPLLLSGRGS